MVAWALYSLTHILPSGFCDFSSDSEVAWPSSGIEARLRLQIIESEGRGTRAQEARTTPCALPGRYSRLNLRRSAYGSLGSSGSSGSSSIESMSWVFIVPFAWLNL